MDADVTTADVYPDSDGKPMADNTLQWDWMVKIVGELREMFAGQQVFVAGDLLWYPIEGEPKTRQEWEEEGFAPRIVFFVRSSTKTPNEERNQIAELMSFCNRRGAEELYVIKPSNSEVSAYLLTDGAFDFASPRSGFISPCLGIGFTNDFANGIFTWKPDIVVTATE